MSLQTDERWTARRLATGPPVTGTVVAWGDDTYGQTAVPSGLTDVVAVAAGQFHTLALQPDGTVTAWGRNDSGQTDIPAGLGHVVAIATHRDHNLASISDGTVVAWGSNTNGEATVPQGLTGVVAVAAGSTHSMALRSDGTVVAWGSDLMGQVDVPSGLTDVVAIDAGGHHSVAVKSDGTVVAWGWNRYGQSTLPRCLPASIGVSCTRFGSLVLLADQTLFGWGSDQNGETTIPSTCGVSAFNAGGYHILAIRVDGTLVGWGSNVNRQLDIPPGVNNVLAVAAGFHHSVALIGPTTRAATATALTSNPNPSVFHQPITASATVTPTSATSQTPTGTVDFFIDGFGIERAAQPGWNSPHRIPGTRSRHTPADRDLQRRHELRRLGKRDGHPTGQRRCHKDDTDVHPEPVRTGAVGHVDRQRHRHTACRRNPRRHRHLHRGLHRAGRRFGGLPRGGDYDGLLTHRRNPHTRRQLPGQLPLHHIQRRPRHAAGQPLNRTATALAVQAIGWTNDLSTRPLPFPSPPTGAVVAPAMCLGKGQSIHAK